MRGCVERRVAVVSSLLMRLRVHRRPVVVSGHRLRRRERRLRLLRRRWTRAGGPVVPGHSGIAVLTAGRRNVLPLAVLLRAISVSTSLRPNDGTEGLLLVAVVNLGHRSGVRVAFDFPGKSDGESFPLSVFL